VDGSQRIIEGGEMEDDQVQEGAEVEADEYDTPALNGCPSAIMKYLREKDHRSFSGRVWQHIDEIYSVMGTKRFTDTQITETLQQLWKKLRIVDIYPESDPKWIRRHMHPWEH
jgi:hypothetical protein